MLPISARIRSGPARRWRPSNNRKAATAPGSRVRIKLLREGKERTPNVTIGDLEQAEATATDWLGIQVQQLTKEMAEEMGQPNLKGVLVTDVAEDSPAAPSIRPGDVIRNVNRQSVTTVAQYKEYMDRAKSAGRVLLLIYDGRTGRQRYQILP